MLGMLRDRFAQDDKSEILPSLCSGCFAITSFRMTKARSFASAQDDKSEILRIRSG
jgi:hypothetical protein